MGRHRMNQTTLAGHLGVSQVSVSRRLRGETPFDIDELVVIAGLFDVTISELTAALRSRCFAAYGLVTTPENQLSLFPLAA